jgi:dihydrofolate reductase
LRGIIYAVSPDGVIGKDGRIPWRHAGDLRRFKRVTSGTTVIMGRRTYASMGKPLPNRRNIVVTSQAMTDVGIECVPSIEDALTRAGASDVWFIGGARIYEEAMRHADVIDVTYVPDRVTGGDLVHAPVVDETVFRPGPLVDHEDEPGLTRRLYMRKKV